jgi:hypothetical protein
MAPPVRRRTDTFVQITIRSLQRFFAGLPAWLIKLTAIARVEAAKTGWRKAVEVAVAALGANQHLLRIFGYV